MVFGILLGTNYEIKNNLNLIFDVGLSILNEE